MDNKQDKTYAGMTRRTLCLGAGGAAVMLGLGGLKYVGSQPIVRPPGGQDEERLSPPASVARSATRSARATSSRPPTSKTAC